MKKITFITSEFPPLPGGIGNHAYFLSKYLQNAGYSITVLTDFREPNADNEFDKNQIFKVERIQRNAFTYISRIVKAFKLSYDSEIIIVSGKFSLWLGALLKLIFLSKKVITVIHGSELKAGGKVSKLLTQLSLKKMDKIVAVSQFTKSLILQINPKLTIEVINNGIEIEELEFEQLPELNFESRINLITVGNLTYRKGQQNVIKALPFIKTKFPSIHYHCVGITTELESFTSLANKLNVLQDITFHGVLTNEKKNSLLKKCSIFCMLSSVLKNGDVEGFGIAVLEANALGLPAIGSNDSGIKDAIENYSSGILINPTDEAAFAKAIHEIISNYNDYSSNAKKWAKKFQWDVISKEYEKVINS